MIRGEKGAPYDIALYKSNDPSTRISVANGAPEELPMKKVIISAWMQSGDFDISVFDIKGVRIKRLAGKTVSEGPASFDLGKLRLRAGLYLVSGRSNIIRSPTDRPYQKICAAVLDLLGKFRPIHC